VKELVVLSGKGGTGKTSLVGSFAALASGAVLADCDVDAADLGLILGPTVRSEHEFFSGQVATIDADCCTMCGMCEQLCRFEAIKDFSVDPLACEGCGLCFQVCPAGAVTMKSMLAGHWYVSDTQYGPLVHARLGVARENSGKLVAAVRRQARLEAIEGNLDLIISDGPPGIGCPVISSLSGVNLALLVTEPTISGISDLERIAAVCRHFGVQAAVCINKHDINEDNTQRIIDFCDAKGLPVLAKIPFDDAFTEAIVRGQPLVSFSDGYVGRQVRMLWQRVNELLLNN